MHENTAPNTRPCACGRGTPCRANPGDGGNTPAPTIGSLFAGIGGFDLGFERAGWRTQWQVEINPLNRAVLAHRFPHAARFADIRHVGAKQLCKVDCITAGFPCQDISTSGYSRKNRSATGLAGKRSGLFFEVVRLLREIQPPWVVLENVPALLHSNDCNDIQEVIRQLAHCGYVGFFRVLDAQYFGSPARRRRVFLVAGLGRYPTIDLLSDAAPVEAISSQMPSFAEPRDADAWPGYTLQATNAAGRISLGSELLVAEQNGWSAMVERARVSRDTRLPLGLDAANLAERFGAGNAVSPHLAQWLANHLMKSALNQPLL